MLDDETPGDKVRYELMDRTAHWDIDVWIKPCQCQDRPERCYTDGKRRYVSCDVCKRTWDIDTKEEIAKGERR